MKKILAKLILLVAAWKLLTVLLAYAVIPLLPLDKGLTGIRDANFTEFGIHLPYGVWVWGNLDGFYYMVIAARHGYLAGQEPFFPLFPWLVGMVAGATGLPIVMAGQLVSLASLIGALCIMGNLLRRDGLPRLYPFLLLLVLTFPTSFFYGSLYNDALFFFLATLCLYWGRKRSWLLASVAGFFATLTRLNGLALFGYLVVEYLMRKKKLAISTQPISFFFLIPAAFAGYLAYIQVKFGNWYALFDAMKVWQQDKPIFPLQVFWRYFKILTTADPTRLNYWVAVGELGFVLFLIALLICGFRRLRLSYWVFFFLSVLIPSMTGTFQGMPRYGLHLYPMYLSLALVLRNQVPMAKLLYIIVSFILFIIYLTFFTRGYFAA